MGNLHCRAGQIEEIHKLFLKKHIGSTREILCVLWNARSLNNKILDFIALLEDEGIDIAAVTEHWMSSHHNHITAELRERGYNIQHYCREEKDGGGVGVIYKNT